MAKALTELSVKKVKADKSRRKELPDPALSGLYLVVQPSGKKSWAFRYRHAGRPRKLTIGSFPEISVDAARKAATTAQEAVDHGNDPAAEKKAEKADAKAGRNTFSTQLERYNRQHLSKLRTGHQNKAALDLHVVPLWGDRDVQTIKRRDVLDLLDDILEDGKATTANRVKAYLSHFFNWCVDRALIEVAPTLGLKPPAKENRRDRVLTDDEIRWFWLACSEIGQPWGQVGMLLLLTGQRLGEVCGMTDDEIDGRTWHLPAERTKNGRAHYIPLTDAARAVISSIERVQSRPGYLHTTTGETPVSGYFKARVNLAEHMEKAALEERGEPVEIPHWTFHDLRRTAATGMARLGIPVRVTEAVLNHVSGTGGGIVAVYQRHDFADEKRSALEAWARFVASVVEGDGQNVVRLAK